MAFQRPSVREAVSSLVNVPNSMSVAGYLLVKDGIERGSTTPRGLAEIALGRTLDLADGFFARMLGQSTAFGAALDAGLDKKATFMLFEDASEKGLVPKIYEDAVYQVNAANTVLTGIAKAVHPKTPLSPSKQGKHAMFGQGIMVGSYLLAETIADRTPRTSKFIRKFGHIAGAVGLFDNGTQATDGYVKRIFKATRQA